MNKVLAYLPIAQWLPGYQKTDATQDGLAAIIVTLMLIPQSLAYAMVAGLPPVYGLYASILPLVVYTLLGTSKTLSVGPVAVVALMTAETLNELYPLGSVEYIYGASILALLSGAVLLIMAVFRLGFLTHFISHPVLSGFMTASGILIIVSQSKHLLGVTSQGNNAVELLFSLFQQLNVTNLSTATIGIGSLLALIGSRLYLPRCLIKMGTPSRWSAQIVKLAPVFVMLLCIAIVSLFHLQTHGVRVVGIIPSGLPALSLPNINLHDIYTLLPAAILISLVGFVESASVGQTLAAKSNHKILPNQELIALSGANIASALSSGFPVTGGLSRSVVNFDAGASTPLAGTFTAIGISLTALYFTPLFESLPQSVLAAIIIVAVSSLIDFKAIFHVWKTSKSDGFSMSLTVLGVLLINVEIGIILGVISSIFLHIMRTSRPHIAVVGLLPNSQHFRNIDRYEVETCANIVTIRIDESLYFVNAQYLEDKIPQYIVDYPDAKHLILMCSGVNTVDVSALDSLKKIISDLKERGITVHLSEVKGPVMDILQHSHFIENLSGGVYIDQFTAYHSVKAICNH
ncbi:SulP family inorganic anion transporter [Psychromonas antarctica]|uniref:SulP family inorganic anion transporter n=1 Tax=Psychromonas antarctica TaxID=67573 RepID=UPI001EE81C45|nr:sulfate permease [Psychromonas antarctica]MCG6202286.1 sulfate permease [Psychromonas antarctica]